MLGGYDLIAFITSRLRYNLQGVVFSQTAISLKYNIYNQAFRQIIVLDKLGFVKY